MKRKARERLPVRAAGSFPSYLYKSLDELDGSWGEPDQNATSLIEECHTLHRKPLLLLSDEEAALALRQRIGLPWVRTLVLQRLRQDPLRAGLYSYPGDLLMDAIRLPAAEWGDLLPELKQIATIVETLPETPDYFDLISAYRCFTNGR